MDFRFTDEQLERREKFFRVCAELSKDRPASYNGAVGIWGTDETWAFHMKCAREFARQGWLSLGWPPEYGGTGDMMDRVLFSAARGYHRVPGMDPFGIKMLAPTLIAVASEEIKRRFLPKIAAAETMWCELWSERDAGSDLAAMSSTAIKDGNDYILNGHKIWVSGAHRAQWGFAVFKSDLTARKHHNLTFLLVDMKTPGITVKPILYMDNDHRYNEVFFDNVRVPAIVVGTENEGWSVVNVLAGFERSGLDEIMRMQRDMDDLVAYCNVTERNGILMASDPLIRSRLAQIASEIEAARTLAYRVADLQNRHEFTLKQAAAVKIFSSELSESFAAIATDILGPIGQIKNSRWAALNGWWESIYQENFMTTISMGTNEIQRNILAWRGLNLPRS